MPLKLVPSCAISSWPVTLTWRASSSVCVARKRLLPSSGADWTALLYMALAAGANDLLLLDQSMPGESGMTLLRRLRRSSTLPAPPACSIRVWSLNAVVLV